MLFSFTLTYLAAVIIAVYSVNPEEANYSNNRYRQDQLLEPLNLVADRETLAYILPRLAAKYKPSGEWSEVTDPRFYVLTEMENEPFENQIREENMRPKRQNFEKMIASQMRYAPRKRVFSINAPMSSLQDLFKQNQLKEQVERNRAILKEVY